MNILAMADVHGDLGIYSQLQGLVRTFNVEVVVLAGDLLHSFRSDLPIEQAQRENAIEILEILHSLSKPVLYIMGNDDFIELGCQNNLVQSIHGRRVTIGRYAFVGYQYSLPFMAGMFEKSESEIAKDLVMIAPLVDANTVFVTHSPAHGSLDLGIPIPGRDTHVGSTSILELIRRRNVRAHIHGHIHQCFGREGIHFNVAAAGHVRGMVINLDDLTHEVIDREKVNT
jgi:Icc-related predicted phosphoesterase